MTTFVYCPFCDKINEADLVTSVWKKDGNVICKKCGRKVKHALSLKTCNKCGNKLYFPSNMNHIEMPCRTYHDQEEHDKQLKEREQAALDAKHEAEQRLIDADKRIQQMEHYIEEKEQHVNEDEMAREMREIPCQSCPSQILRIKDGKFSVCPNCHNAPSKAYIAERWQKLTGKTPDLIQWGDLEGRQIIHVDQRGAFIPPYSVLLVAHDKFVVYDGDGRRQTLTAEVYPIFKNPYTEEEKIRLLNNGGRAEALSLGLGTRIIFFSEHEHELNYNAHFQFDNNRWAVTLPLTITMQMHEDNAENIMRHGMDLTDDTSATASLESLVTHALADKIYRFFLEHDADESLEEVETDNQLKRWLIRTFTIRELEQITNEISDDLSQRYGIQLPQTIKMDVSNITVMRSGEIVKVACPARIPNEGTCDYYNYIKKDDYQKHNPFSCEKCGKRIVWCPGCNSYVTTKIHGVCDPQGHKIYRKIM